MPGLDLLSERVAPTGNASAEGLKRVLGAPALDRLSVVVRESVQNSWDARQRSQGDTVRVQFSYRDLNEAQSHGLRNLLDNQIPESVFGKSLEAWLAGDELSVLEVADFGTVGLSGPVHADEMPAPGEPAHFVDFIRNVGKTHEQVEGGTYGFGKSSFYALSQVSTIFVDTVTAVADGVVRRVMLAGLGEQYVAHEDGKFRNYTGRHWWGRQEGHNRIAPLTGEDAEAFARLLGLPPRSKQDTGTTIGVLAPRLGQLSSSDIATSLVRGILLNFWPKMVPGTEGRPAITFSVCINGQNHRIPPPEEVPPFTYFVEALRRVRSQEENPPTAATLRTGRPVVELGRLALYQGPRLTRPSDLMLTGEQESAGERLFTDLPSAHVAEMRSGELVVRYVSFEQLPNPNWEWAGVFRTTSDGETERAFADSEPPTHDAWNVNALDNREHQRWLRSYTRQLREQVRAFLAPNRKQKPHGYSLGRASAALGAMLPGFGSSDVRSSGTDSGGSRRRRSTSRHGRLHKPRFREYQLIDGQPAAVFEVDWTPGTEVQDRMRAELQPTLLYEGRLVNVAELPPGMGVPRVLAVRSQDDEADVVWADTRVDFDAVHQLKLLITVSIENELAGGLNVGLVP